MEGLADASISVVVVDDDDFVRGVVVRQLTSLKLGPVRAAPDWPEARAMLRGPQPCKLVVTDLDMPGARGSAFLQEMAEIAPGISLILMSSLDAPVLRSAEKQARKLGLQVLGSIPKPTTAEAFRQLLPKPQ